MNGTTAEPIERFPYVGDLGHIFTDDDAWWMVIAEQASVTALGQNPSIDVVSFLDTPDFLRTPEYAYIAAAGDLKRIQANTPLADQDRPPEDLGDLDYYARTITQTEDGRQWLVDFDGLLVSSRRLDDRERGHRTPHTGRVRWRRPHPRRRQRPFRLQPNGALDAVVDRLWRDLDGDSARLGGHGPHRAR